MIRSIFLMLLLSLNAQALQILQPKDDHNIVKQRLDQFNTDQSLSSKQVFNQLKKSAKSGDTRSQFSLANMYHKGINVKQNVQLTFLSVRVT